MSANVVVARDVVCGYAKEDVVRLGHLEVSQGRIHGLIGANGTGKTTMLRTFAGQLRAGGESDDSGELEVLGADPYDNAAVMDRVVLMGIDVSLPESFSVKKLFALGKARWLGWDQAGAEEMAARFGLNLDKRFNQLSRGQKSAVGIIMALASGCELVLLDEPYLGLDVDKREVFYQVLREAARGDRTFIVSTHHLSEAEAVLDEIILISNRKRELSEVLLTGPTAEIVEAMLEVTGTGIQMERLEEALPAETVLDRQVLGGQAKMVIDLREHEDLLDVVHRIARARQLTLEDAVRFLQRAEAGHGGADNAQ